MSQNYYVILGVPSNATQSDIKAAYRKLAKELHPDYYGEEHAPFQILQEAYSVLSDPESRKTYDNSLQHNAQKQQYQHAAPARRYSADTVEPLSPSGHQGFQHYWSGFDSMYEQFSGSFRRQRQPSSRQFNKLTLE
ncbi:MAG: DnaJ domain-containing protein, partial [Proteobacteria bacterium]|nr:DnaJ domain-containing protein [Pseudomonadota bacterium]